MTLTNKIDKCEVCGNTDLTAVLDLGLHPMCDDLVAIGDSRKCTEYPIEILFCSECITAHQRYQVPKNDLFPRTYHYRSRFTADVLDGMSALVDACEKRVEALQGKLVLDIGCNDTSLLGFFQKRGARTIGVEPTDAYLDGLNNGHELINAFFSPETAMKIFEKYGYPDIITFTNVFAHIENLPKVIEALKKLIGLNTMLVIENHYLGAVLDRHQFDTFYHEHPRTYSLNSFQCIAQSMGVSLSGVEFPSRYGGNIRVFMGAPPAQTSNEDLSIEGVLNEERLFGERLQNMQSKVDDWRLKMSARIMNIVEKQGKLVAKAFPGRAAILVKLLDLNADTIECVYEKPGSMKIGHYVPGTRIPIRSDNDFLFSSIKPSTILNLAWHISGEINTYLKKHGYTGEVIDILNPSEFVRILK